MRTSFGVLAVLAALAAAPSNVRSADDPPAAPAAEAPPAPPAEVPPAAPSTPEPRTAPDAAPQQAIPPGQWVYTQQYGWVWMPYAEGYVSYPPDAGGDPYMFVYYPTFGWTWVVAPWVWGWGPWPYFGVRGPWLFAWYGWGWWRSPRHWQLTHPRRDYPFPVYRRTPFAAPRPALAPARPGRGGPAPAPGRAPARAPGRGSGPRR
jgi:hypothetical protein